MITPSKTEHTAYYRSSSPGVGLLDLFVLGEASEPQIRRFSAVAYVEATTEASLLAGFRIAGNAAKTLLVRGLGPSLRDSGATLREPRLTLTNEAGQTIAVNAGWQSSLTSVFGQFGASPLPQGSKDSALLVTLQPGTYVLTLNSTDNGSGLAALEIHEAR